MVDKEAFALEGVSKDYGPLHALSEVSFSVAEGEAVGYLGPNGAGKTTTLKLLSGLTRPSVGHLRLGGVDPSKDRRRALSRVGVLVETPGVLPYTRGSDLLEHIARVKGLTGGEVPSSVERAAELLDVVEPLARPLGSLSTGQLRRVLLAGALIGDPRVLVLDEPTMGLDPVARTDLRRILRGLRTEGRTLFLSTHLLEDVQEVCDRVLFLKSGRLVGDVPVSAVEKGDRTSRRTLRVRLAVASTLEAVRASLPPGVEVVPQEGSEGRQFVLNFTGDEASQAGVLRSLVVSGLPISRAEPQGSDLAALYLEKVGREEAT